MGTIKGMSFESIFKHKKWGTNFFYKELKKIYSELPDLKDLVKIYSEYQLSILNPNAEGKKYLEIERKLNFPQTKELIREYWVDQEPLRKRDAYMWYKILSNQIHAVVFFEGYEARTIDLQLLGFLLILHWEFLSSIKEELSKNSQAEIDKFIQEIKKESNNFISEWRIKKKLI
jgi:hypothetical protein